MDRNDMDLFGDLLAEVLWESNIDNAGFRAACKITYDRGGFSGRAEDDLARDLTSREEDVSLLLSERDRLRAELAQAVAANQALAADAARMREALDYSKWAGNQIANCIKANLGRQHEKIEDAVTLGREVSLRSTAALEGGAA